MSGQERTGDRCEAEVEQPTEQGVRPVCMRKPSNCYGKWILPVNGLQQMLDHLKETIIAEEGKNTAGKPIILSVR